MITETQAKVAVKRLSVLPFFPAEEFARAELARLFLRMVSETHQLEWLITMLVDRCAQYSGPKEIRGVFCTRFKPKDGIEEYSTISGFTPGDSESQTLIADSEYKRIDAELPRGGGLKRITGSDTIQ